MRNVVINLLKESDVTPDALYELRKTAFLQWEEQGLDTSEAYIPLEQFRKNLASFIVFVALDKDTGELLGMHTFKLNKKKGRVRGSNLSVLPAAKHEGIASRMLEVETERLRKAGYRYMVGDTAIPATWSVRWHLKNGYRIMGYSHGEGQNYASYVFRKQIYIDLRHHPLDLLWTRPLAPLTARLCFIVSYLATHLCKYSDGSLNALGRLTKGLKKRIERSEKAVS